MRLTKSVLMLCCLLFLKISQAQAGPTDSPHTVKGVVITPDGTVVPEFSVVVRQMTDRPKLIPRKHFKNGEFALEGLERAKYQIQISAPLFITTKLTFDFKAEPRHTEYRIVILHPYRNEVRLEPGAASTVSVKVLQQKVPDAAREAYIKAVHLHREGRLEESLIEYGRALRHFPKYFEALTDIGTVFLLFNRPQSALLFLRRAQDIDDCNTIVNLNIAVALTEQGDYGGAFKLLKKVRRAEPRMALAQYFMAKIYYLQRKYPDAETWVRQAVENDPALLDAWALLTAIGVEQKKFDQAREGLERIRDALENRTVTEFIDQQLSALGN